MALQELHGYELLQLCGHAGGAEFHGWLVEGGQWERQRSSNTTRVLQTGDHPVGLQVADKMGRQMC